MIALASNQLAINRQWYTGYVTFGTECYNTALNITKNIPLDSCQNIPQSLVGQQYLRGGKGRRYIKKGRIIDLAENTYRHNYRGITFPDLLSNGLASHKEQAQSTLKYYLGTKVLFTPTKRRPQQYYPTCLKSDVMKLLSKNIPIQVIGVQYNNKNNSSKTPTSEVLFRSSDHSNPRRLCLTSVTFRAILYS